MNTKNLLKLADFLETEITDEQFDIRSFRRNKDGKAELFYTNNECGSIGCALGWTPFVEGLEVTEDDFYFSTPSLNFHKYSNRVFGDLDKFVGDYVDDLFYKSDLDGEELESLDIYSLWDFIFSSGWFSIEGQGTRLATSNRIRIACEGLIR